jgi:hypothetical protein
VGPAGAGKGRQPAEADGSARHLVLHQATLHLASCRSSSFVGLVACCCKFDLTRFPCLVLFISNVPAHPLQTISAARSLLAVVMSALSASHRGPKTVRPDSCTHKVPAASQPDCVIWVPRGPCGPRGPRGMWMPPCGSRGVWMPPWGPHRPHGPRRPRGRLRGCLHDMRAQPRGPHRLLRPVPAVCGDRQQRRLRP